jgi:vacuolar protein sorting-associated protein 52
MYYLGLLERLAGNFSNIKDQRVFFINNFSLVLDIFQERQLMSEEFNNFETLLLTQRELFAEEEVKTFFPRLVAFVMQTEQQMAGVEGKIPLDETIVADLVREFAANWRSGAQQINDDVLVYFANFRNGMEILKQVF